MKPTVSGKKSVPKTTPYTCLNLFEELANDGARKKQPPQNQHNMDKTVPSEEDIITLEKGVESARRNLRLSRDLLHDGDALREFTPTEVLLTMFPVYDPPEGEKAEAEEARLVVVLTSKGELGKAIEALEIAKEKRRVDEVVKAREKEINFGKGVDLCPICLDPLYAGHCDRRYDCWMPCCGNYICPPCNVSAGDQNFYECPLCRQHFLRFSDAYVEKRKQMHAKTKPHIQMMIGREYFDGKRGGICESNDKKAISYIKMAAEGGHAEAQAFLGELYATNQRGIFEKSPKDSFYWRELAASNGHIIAHMELAKMYFWGKACEVNTQLYHRAVTFAAHHQVLRAQILMAKAYSYLNTDIEGIPKSYERAKYWIGKVVHSTELEISREGCFGAYAKYAETLLALGTQNTNGVIYVGGYSSVSVPEILYWFRKAAHHNVITPIQVKLVEKCHVIGSRYCHCCRMSSVAYEIKSKGEMQKCKRCNWARYCSRECQLRHWRGGHKNDCKAIY